MSVDNCSVLIFADIHTAYETIKHDIKAEHIDTLDECIEHKLVSKCAAFELVSTPGTLTPSVCNDNNAYEQANISLCSTNVNSAYEHANNSLSATDKEIKHDTEVTHAYNYLTNFEGQDDTLQNLPISDSSIICDWDNVYQNIDDGCYSSIYDLPNILSNDTKKKLEDNSINKPR